jgi:glucose-1-phosphatase
MSFMKNLIFDFGGVIIDIQPMAYVSELLNMGCNDLQGLHAAFIQEGVYRKFETGQLSASEFRDRIRHCLSDHASDEEIDHAWNLIIGEIPAHRIQWLQELKAKYRTFLLSNTNPIHYEHYQEYTLRTFGFPLNSLFEKAYFSFQMDMYKPDHEIFEFVLNDSGLNPAETVFIDDMAENVEAARKCGMSGIVVKPGDDVTEIMKDF